MPVLINEVSVEIEDGVTEPGEAAPAAQQLPMSVAEIELAQTLALLQERQHRLKVD